MTNTQFLAADPNRSVWLSAHAGTGKTKVLIDRVLRLLIGGAKPASIVCITYTKAAAMEMQLRIRGRLSEWSLQSDDELIQDLNELLGRAPTEEEQKLARTLLCQLLEDVEGVNIKTIHAFCQSLLNRFPVEAGIAPHFSLMDERTQSEMLHEARQRLFAKALEDENPALAEAIEHIAGHMADVSLQKLLEALIHKHALLYTYLGREGGHERFVERIYDGLGLQIGVNEASLLQTLKTNTEPYRSDLVAGIRQLETGKQKTQKELAEKLARWLESDFALADFEASKDAFVKKDGEKKTPRSFCTDSFVKENPDLAKALLDYQQLFAKTVDQLNAIKVARFSEAVVAIAAAILDLYRHQKESAGLLDYEDLILRTIFLLGQEDMCGWVMEKLGYSIQHLLIDEAQDTNPAQWELTRMLVSDLFILELYEGKPRTLFVVGDKKQSIYSFQGAEPQKFHVEKESYREWFEQSDQAFESLTLDRSFRSTQAVLNAVDAVCALPVVQRSINEGDIAHDVHRAKQAGLVELWPLVLKEETETPPPWEVDEPLYDGTSANAELAEKIARTIASWLKEKRPLPAKGRAVRAGDIMILVRRRNELVTLLNRKLRLAGVPVAGADRVKLNEHLAVKDVLIVAEWCLLAHDDLTLATVLKGPWFKWNDEQLYQLAYGRGERSLWYCLQDKHEDVAAKLEAIRQVAQTASPYELLSYLLDELEGKRQLICYFGEEAEELCHELLNQAQAYEESHTPSLQHFVHWIRMGDGEIKREMQQAEDAVRIMTVHGAKGLQAPIVILPDTTQFRSQSDALYWKWVKDQTVCYAMPSGIQTPKAIAELKDTIKQEEMEEYCRLLYVAMTRAEDELYIGGVQTAKNLQADCWYDLVQQAMAEMPNVEKTEQGGLRYALHQDQQAEAKQKDHEKPTYPAMPDWMAKRYAKPQPVFDAEEKTSGDDSAAIRGTIIHKLLQWLPSADFPKNDALKMASAFVPPEVEMPINELVDEAYAVRSNPEWEWIFAKGTQAEVPLCGDLPASLQDQTRFRQIDRLIVQEKDVYIIDFKTGKQVPESAEAISDDYLLQLSVYRDLIGRLYPNHAIHCGLLWTAKPELMIVNSAFLDRTLSQLDSSAA